MRRTQALALALTSLLLGGCTNGTLHEPTPTTATTERSAAASPTLHPGQRAHDVGVEFQSGPFVVTIGQVVHDRDDDVLHLGVRLRNVSNGWRAPVASGVLLLGGVEQHVAFDATPGIPPGVAADFTASASTGGADPIADGVLRWGNPDETVTLVHLSDGHAEGFGPPLNVPVSAWGHIGKHTVHVTGAHLHADSLHGAPLDTGHHLARFALDEYSSAGSHVNGFVPMDHFLLEWPDGTVVEPLSGSPGRATATWTASTGDWVDFAVPPDPAGSYRLLLASVSRTALSHLHPDLVERAVIPIDLPAVSDHGPRPADAITLPRPRLPSAQDGAQVADAIDVTLDVGEVNVPGFALAPRRLHWDPSRRTATIEATVRRIPPVQVDEGDGLLAVDPQFAPRTSLMSGGRIRDGLLLTPIPSLGPRDEAAVAWEFPFVDDLEPADATLLLGEERTPASTIPLGPDSPHLLDPPVPVERPITAPAATAGNYVVQLVSWRVGVPRPLDRPPAGMQALEVTFDVTAVPVENPGAFGFRFTPRTQLFISLPDGYLQQPDNHDHAFLEPGETARLGASWYVPAGWQPTRMAFTIRSVDEITAINDGWVEVTFPADLHSTGEPEGTS